MTKKRFKFGLAALGLCAAFFIALIALLLAPTLASADKNSGTAHGNEQTHGGAQGGAGGAPNPIYFQNGNDPADGPGNSSGDPTEPCADKDKSCAGSGDKPDGQYFDSGGSAGNYGNSGGNSGSSNGSGNGSNSGGNGAPGFNSGFYAGGGGNGNGGNGGGGTGGNGGGGNGGGDGKDHQPPGGNPPPDNGPPTFLIPPPDGSGPDGPQPPVISTGDPLQVPEPLTMSLFAVGLAGTAAMRRRQKGK